MNPFVVLALAIDLLGMALIVAGVFVGDGPCWALIVGGASTSFVGAMVLVIGYKAGSFYGLAPRLATAGVPANATLEAVRPTGVVIGGAQVLRFQLMVSHDAHDYPLVVQQAAPRRLLTEIVSGARLGVRVDPAHPDRVAIDWSQPITPPRAPANPAPATPARAAAASPAAAPPASAPAAKPAAAPTPTPTAEDLLARGRRGIAHITAVRELGDAVALGVIPPADERAGAKMASLDLEVKLPGREAYPARVVSWVPAGIGPLEPGRALTVAVDREDPEHRLAIDWQTPPV